MERIGIAASKIAKDNLLFYNLYVILISFVIALILFLIAGGAVFLAMVAIGVIAQGTVPEGFKNEWRVLLQLCMMALTVAVSLITVFAIAKNLKFRKR